MSFYFVHDVTDPSNVSKYELELDEPPELGEPLQVGSIAYEVTRLEGVVIEVVRKAAARTSS